MLRVARKSDPPAWKLDVESSVRDRLYGERREVRATPVRHGKPEALAGRYRLLERIGSGGTADVYRAHDEWLRRDVAAKTIAPWLAYDPAAVRRLRREAALCARLAHPHIPAVLDVGQRPRDFIVMELIDGRDLAALFKHEASITTARAIDMLLQLCGALAHAHSRGVLHCDVSPRNVVIGQADDSARLVDFGLAVELSGAGPGGKLLGTPGYVAPERLRGAAPSPEADVYSLGVLAYRLLGGPLPWQRGAADATSPSPTASLSAPSLARLRPDLPKAMAGAVDAAMASRPAARPATVAELRARLLATSRETAPLRAA